MVSAMACRHACCWLMMGGFMGHSLSIGADDGLMPSSGQKLISNTKERAAANRDMLVLARMDMQLTLEQMRGNKELSNQRLNLQAQ